MKRRIVATILVLAMVLALFPSSVLAAQTQTIDFTNQSNASKFEIVNNTRNLSITNGTGLTLTTSRPAFEDCNGQNSGSNATTPEEVVRVPVSGDWTATLQFTFNRNNASNGYYQFFGFYAAQGSNYQNMAGIRGGDGAMQNFLRKNGTITADTESLNSTPGLASNGTYWYRIVKSGTTYTCYRSSNGTSFTRMFSYADTGIAANYLIMDAYTGMTTGYQFVLKSLELTTEGSTSSHTHNYTSTVTAPTCTANGYTTYTCTSCGDSYTDTTASALGHSWNNGTVTTAATQTSAGVKTYTCSRCGSTKTEAIPALGSMGLKDYFQDYFKVGVAVGQGELNNQAVKNLILREYNTLTCENEMKPDSTLNQSRSQSSGNNVNPQVQLSSGARAALQFCQDNNIPMRGHVFIWHQQTPSWFFRENFSNNGNFVSPAIMDQRIDNYIKNLFALLKSEYPRVNFFAFDIVNEAVANDEPYGWRPRYNGNNQSSYWTDVYGQDNVEYIYTAFRAARKYAPANCKLCYNDYDEYLPGKVDAIYNLAKDLYDKGLIDALGMQSHMTVGNPTIELYRAALDKFATIGCPLMITELDLQARNNDFEEQGDFYRQCFEAYIEHSDKIESVAFWGIRDDSSWRPQGKPLLFAGNNYQPKDSYYKVISAIPTHEHTYAPVAKDATCTEDGYIGEKCTQEDCSKLNVTTVIPRLGHDWENVVTIQPTETTSGLMVSTCNRCGETQTKQLAKLGTQVIDFTDPASANDFTLVNQASSAITAGTGLTLTTTRDAIEDCNGQNSGSQATTPKDLVQVPVSGDWTATLKFNFNQNNASNGYYQFFGFFAAEGSDYQNLAGIRGGDGAMQNFLRKNGTITADTESLNSTPGLASNGTYWYRIVKEDTTYTCYRSSDGENFTEMFSYANTGIEASSLLMDAYTGMTTGYQVVLKSLTIEPATPPHTHDFQVIEVIAPTCTADGYSIYACACGETAQRDTVSALGHDLGAWTQNVAPTCTAKGAEVRTCSRCDATETREIAALGHDLGAWAQSVAPTCTAKGAEVRTCSRCDATETREIAALGHDIINGTAVAPTCTTAGLTGGGQCARCDYTIAQEVVPALGHSYSSWNQVTAPTCTTQGSAVRGCVRCDVTETQLLAALGHAIVNDPAVAPTCTATGLTAGSHCSRCDYAVAQETVDALGHNMVTDAAVAPTCAAAGLTAGSHCTRCSYKVAQTVVPATGDHTYDEGTCTVCGAADPSYQPPRIDIDFTNRADASKFQIANNTNNISITNGTGLTLTTSRAAFEDCNGQNSGSNATTPAEVVKVPVSGDWTATLKFNFNKNNASNGYYQFFGFYAAQGSNYQNMAGIRGGDGAMQNFLRKNGSITADTESLNSTPGLASNGTYWYRIVKSGTTYTCYRSSNGTSFTRMFSYTNTGIEADYLIMDAYTGMTTGYQVILKSLSIESTATTPHTHNFQRGQTVAPTCITNGYTVYTCACGETEQRNIVAATGAHTYSNGVCTVCGAADPNYQPSRIDIDFTNRADASKFQIANNTSNLSITNGTGLTLTTSRAAFEDCNGQNSGSNATTPAEVVKVPVSGDWTATLKFNFNKNNASNGYYQFFGFYAAQGSNYQNMAGIRGGDGAMQNFLRKNGSITADTESLNSTPGLASNGTYWYRIVKSGTTYTCYRSSNGTSFTRMFSYTNTGIEADYLIMDAYTGMTTGYQFTLKSLVVESNN